MITRKFFLLLIVPLFLMSCVQRESDVGIGAIVDVPSDHFTVVSGTAIASASFKPHVTYGSSQSLHTGQIRDFFAFSAIQFNIPDAMPDSFRVDTTTEMSIRLRRNHIYPVTGIGELRFAMREVTQEWTEASLYPESFTDRETFPVLDSGLVMLGTDSTLTGEVPRELWERWLADDSTTYGILIEPRFEAAMVEWYSSEYVNSSFPEYPPALVVRTQVWRSSDSTWIDSIFDISATDDAFLVRDSAPRPTGRLFASQGIRERLALFFPVDTLALMTRTVARAQVHLFRDNGNPAEFEMVPDQNMTFSDGVMLDSSWTFGYDSTTGVWTSDSSLLGVEYLTNADEKWDSTTSVYTLDVTSIVSSWVKNASSNGGMQVIAINESGYISRLVFHSWNSEDINKRPRLYIWLTESE